jgi:Zn ribbon nucleic-acid-binding protein
MLIVGIHDYLGTNQDRTVFGRVINITYYIIYNSIDHAEVDKRVRIIKNSYPVQKYTCPCCEESTKCPECSRDDLLRAWDVNGMMFALCYYCGTVFYRDTCTILEKLEKGQEDSWGARCLALIGMIGSNLKKGQR